ncbi:hypothetical protein Neosp_004072 [[Neocosmospora] mangrovei]
MALNEPEKSDIFKLVSDCKCLFKGYLNSTSAPSEPPENAKQHKSRFFALEPDLVVFARSKVFLNYDDIHALVTEQLSVLRTNLEFEWVHQLKGKTLDAFQAIEAIIGRLEHLKDVIRQLSEIEDCTEKGTTRSQFLSIRRVVKSNSPTAFPYVHDHLATSILERHSSLRQRMNQQHRPTNIQRVAFSGGTSTSADYPKPPKAEYGKPAPQCPYCYKVLESSNLSQPGWEDHVNEDLSPYVCPIYNCDQRATPFLNDDAWARHMNTRHPENWPRTLCESRTGSPELACPLCDSWSPPKGANDESWRIPNKREQLNKHIGKHLLRLAFDGLDKLERNPHQTSPAFSSEDFETVSGRHESSLRSDNPSNEGESIVTEGHGLEQDEPNVSEAIDMPVRHNPVAATEKDGRPDMTLKRSNNDNSSTTSSTSNLESCKSHRDTCAEAETVYQTTTQLPFRSSNSERPVSLSSMDKTGEEYCKAPEPPANALGASSHCDISIKGSQANALVKKDDIAGAEKIYQEILDLGTEVLGEEHPHRLACRSNLASILERKGEYAEAEVIYRDVWELQQRTLGDRNPDTIASYNKLANALTRLRRFDEAVLIYEKALKMRKNLLGAKHSDTIITLGNLANALQNQGQHDEAKKMYSDAMALGEDVPEDEHLQWIRARYQEVL